MIATLVAAVTSRIAGPAGIAAAAVLALVAAGQCSAKNTEGRRADRAEAALAAEREDHARCKTNVAGLDAALQAQNAALAARSAQDAQRLTEAGKRLSEAQKGRESAEARAAALLRSGPVGVDACARAISAFEAVKEQAR